VDRLGEFAEHGGSSCAAGGALAGDLADSATGHLSNDQPCL
jgi:hypothetical protein